MGTHLLPHGFDSAHAAADVAVASHIYSLQKLLGEDPSKTSKVKTKIVVTNVICSERQVVTACANTTVLSNTLVEHDTTSLSGANTPFVHLTARKIGIIRTSHECMKYMTKYRCNAKLHYYAFVLLNRIHCILYKVLRDEASIQATNTYFGPNCQEEMFSN